MQETKSSTAAALHGIWLLLLVAFVMAALYLAQAILMPLALAALLTFLIAPIVTLTERWIGRIASVLAVVLMLFAVIGFTGWVLTRQVVDLAARLPDYKGNIQAKLLSLKVPGGGAFKRLSETIEEIKIDVVGTTPTQAGTIVLPGSMPAHTAAVHPPAAADGMREVVLHSPKTSTMDIARTMLGMVLGPLGTSLLIILLVIIMLLQREDLRARLIRLIGKSRISHTTHAMDDAGSRVSRYLRLQLAVNVAFGICIGTGLSLMGMPMAVLCGVLAAVLRFIPYVGPWIAAAGPIALSLAISDGWMTLLMVLGLFLVLEVIIANFVEPWVYGSNTGVSPMALVVAAVFWTWLWGPAGLALSTPLTVCLVVMGRHVSKLEFLSVLLSDEEALAPHEECYHRLLAQDLIHAEELAESFLKTNSVTGLCDEVLIPVIIAVEMDCRHGAVDDEQRADVLLSIRDFLGELDQRPADDAPENDPPAPIPSSPCHILCIPARAERDDLAGLMLAQLLRAPAFDAQSVSSSLLTGEVIDLAETSAADAVCISVVPPTTLVHARHLCTKLRARLPHLKIVVGLWHATEISTESAQRLRTSGADEVVGSLAEAVTQLSKRSAG